MGKFTALVFLFSLIANFAIAEEGFTPVVSGLPQNLKQVDDATVAYWRFDGTKQLSQATAFLVKVSGNKGLFLTNFHVIASCPGSDCDIQIAHHYKIVFGRPVSMAKDSWSTNRGKVVASDSSFDLAAFVVDLPKNASLTPVEIREWTATDGRRVYAIGTPMVSRRSTWHVTKPDTNPQSFWSTGEAATYAPSRSGERLYHTADLLPGSSGGPLIDENGRVIGINASISKISGFEYDSTYTGQAVPARVIQQFLSHVSF